MEQWGINTSSAQEEHVRSVLTGKKNRYGRRRMVALSAAVRTASRVFGDVNSGGLKCCRCGDSVTTALQRSTQEAAVARDSSAEEDS
jgi:hypothetical protein